MFKVDCAISYYKTELKTGGNVSKSQIDLLKLLKKNILTVLDKQDISDDESYKLFESVKYCRLIEW